jgi:hypothetical protein
VVERGEVGGGEGHVVEGDEEGETFGEGRGQRLVGLRAFVEGDEAMGAGVERLAEADGEARRAAFGHGEEEGGGVREKAARADEVAGGERGGEVHAAEELVVGDGRVDLAAGQGERVEERHVAVADGPGAGAEPEAAQAFGVHREEGEGERRAAPGVVWGGVGHSAASAVGPKSSSTVRATRVVEPASSSGSRRRRWRSAEGAMRRRCLRVTDRRPRRPRARGRRAGA